MELKDICVNKVRKNKCKKLVVDICLGTNDIDKTFKQTSQQQEEVQRSVFKRLSSLDGQLQLYIADKYYNGSMPWQKGGRRI